MKQKVCCDECKGNYLKSNTSELKIRLKIQI